MTDNGSTTDPAGRPAVETDVESILSSALDARGATAFAHVGPCRDPGIRYCASAFDRLTVAELEPAIYAIAYDGDEWLVRSSQEAAAHPAARLADELSSRLGGTMLTFARIPHDAALHLENGGFELASTDAIERARVTKTADERGRIERAQRAAQAGIQRAASLLATATVDDGRLALDGETLSAATLRTEIDHAVLDAGAVPTSHTAVRTSTDSTTLRPGVPIVLAVAPRGPDGYHGGLVRTLVVDGEGGRERRAHVAVTQAFRSSRAMLTAGGASVTAVEADLEAEIRAFGEDDAIETRVTGVGLEPRERPLAGDEQIEPGHVVRLEAAARVADEQWIRIADLLEVGDEGVEWLAPPPHSLEPANALE
ncbi:M24 family metallopeptidase [Natrialbaceae archaeon A-arb3/5]